MGFLSKIFSTNDIVEKKDTVPDQGKTVSNDHQEDISLDISENIVFTPTPVNLMNKLFHKQKNALSEAPETLYENEAWAPETEFVGLFRKHRVNTEEQSTSASDTE